MEKSIEHGETIKPILNWNDVTDQTGRAVWWERYLNQYQVEVQKISNFIGHLVVFDHLDGDKPIFEKDVGIPVHPPISKPDSKYIKYWENLTAEVITNLKAESENSIATDMEKRD